jgi:glutamine cyclotransferase
MKTQLVIFSLVFLGLSISGRERAMPHTIPVVVRTITHDTGAFTQGLFYYKGLLYESTGLYGQSSLRILDAKDGSIRKTIPVPDIFAEGCARMDSSLVQLSWREQGAPVYRFPSLELRSSLSYSGEGWGLTADSALFYMSNGSDTLYARDKRFAIRKKIPVTFMGKPLQLLNELEYVKGLIYANVWYSDSIFVIQPRTGVVIRLIDCTSLVAQNAAPSNQNVLNGIAYNPETRIFYITGKRWRYIFEVKL